MGILGKWDDQCHGNYQSKYQMGNFFAPGYR